MSDEEKRLAVKRREWAAAEYRQSGVYDRHRTQVIEKFSPGQEKVIEQLVHASSGLFLISGVPWIGKTTLIAEVIRRKAVVWASTLGGDDRVSSGWDFSSNGYHIYRTCAGMFEEMKSCFDPGGPSESKLMWKLKFAKILVIDEIDKPAMDSAWRWEKLTEILDARYGAMRLTVMLSNVVPETLKNTLGQHIWRRLQEDGGAIVLGGRTFATKGASHGNA